MPDTRLNCRAATEHDLQAIRRFPQNEDELFFCFPKAALPLNPGPLREALAFSKCRASDITVACFNHNAAGLMLHPSLGFQPCAIEERQDWQGRRVALIHLQLPRPQGVIP